MSNAGFQLFNELFPVGANVLYAACLALFVKSFMPGQICSYRKLLVIFSAFMTISLLCNAITAPQGLTGLLMTFLLIGGSGILGLEKTTAFLLMILFWNSRVSAGLMIDSLSFILEQLFPLQAESPELLYLHTAVLVVLFLLSHAALLAFMLYFLQRQLKKRQIPLRRQEVCCISLIPAAGILFGQIIAKLLFEFKDGILLELYERHPEFLAIVPLLAIFFYTGTLLTIMFQQEMAVLRKERAGCLVKKQQTQEIQARIREVEQHYALVRRLKHEMRGHLTNIMGLAQSKEYESLKDYILQVNGSIHDIDLTLQTGNPVTDIILGDIKKQCRNKNISLQMDFQYPQAGNYNALDIGIILQNLLQNALEACEKVSPETRRITLTGKRKERFFLIEVKNSFSGDVKFDQNGMPATTKTEEAFLHGIGLSNVRQETQKYMGELELKVNQQQFCATVLLQERSNYE